MSNSIHVNERKVDPFSETLIKSVKGKYTPACVGLDPQLELVPEKIRNAAYKRFGKGLRGAAEALYQFNCRIIDVISPHVGIVKPQIAFYETFGHWGTFAYTQTIKYAHKHDLIVIGDIKRGDVPHTAEAYAAAHLAGPYAADAVTVNPYFGEDGITPFIEKSRELGKGVFVLVKTTNPSSEDFQHLRSGGKRLYEHVAEKVDRWGEPLIGKGGYSSIGAVVGVKAGRELRNLMPNTIFLVPGYGAQGATAEDIKYCFNPNGYGAIISASRSIIYAWHYSPWKEKYGQERWEEAVEEAVIKMKQEIGNVLQTLGNQSLLMTHSL